MPQKHSFVILILIIIGVAAAVACGWFFGEAMLQIEWLGTLFLNALKMMIVPLILAAVISGVASFGDMRKLGRLGGITLSYYLCTVAMAVGVGLVLVNLIQPGSGLEFEQRKLPEAITAKQEIGFSDILLSIVAPNLVASAAETKLLPLIFFGILFGAALTTLGKQGEPVARFFDSLHEVMMKVVSWILYLTPVGIFALVAARLGESGGGQALLQEIAAVGWHIVTVLSGLAVHVVMLFLILMFIAHRGVPYFVGMLQPIFTAFGTASSSATLPLTMQAVQDNEVDNRAARLVLPLGSTVNMDGTALYEAAAAMFIAQAYGVDLGLGQQVLLFITATLAAIGAAGIPEAGLVTMVIVLKSVGLPLEGIGLLLAVDWFLDRFRTAVNVWGDTVGAAVVHRFLSSGVVKT